VNADALVGHVTAAARAHVQERISRLDALTVELRKALTPWQKHPVRLVETRLTDVHAPKVQAALAELVSEQQIWLAVEAFLATHPPETRP
jgi:hypothetical protein